MLVEGASISPERLKRVIPIFEEGSVDEDLLNEGNRRLRDYYQRLGYFDVKVEHERQSTTAERVTILYKVRLGPRRRVERVSVAGNRYFDSATLKDLLSVHAADSLDRHGAYSQALVTADINALQAVYQNNGFSKVKITPRDQRRRRPKSGKTAPLAVVYRIEEGEQLRVGTVRLEGNEHVEAAKLTPLLNTDAGQLLSPRNLAGDRDALLTDYMSRGFDQVRVEVTQQIEPADASKVDVVFHITEGQQIFVRKVLLTGLHYTRPETVAKAITLHPGDPLNETALMETQRNLYDFALFNEVDTAIENPYRRRNLQDRAAAGCGGAALGSDLWLRSRGADRNTAVQLRRHHRQRRQLQPQRQDRRQPPCAWPTLPATISSAGSNQSRCAAPTDCWNRRSTCSSRTRTSRATGTSASPFPAATPTAWT